MLGLRDLERKSDKEFLSWLSDHLGASTESRMHHYIQMRLRHIHPRDTNDTGVPVVGRF